MKKLYVMFLIIVLLVTFTGCENINESKDTSLEEVSVILDWVPNTNHTGLYVAKEKGYYEEEGLDVNILMGSGGGSAEPIAANQGEFGISYQEQVTYALTSENPLPIKAIAAVIQHNTSGMASPKIKNIETPKDFEGKKYGGWGSPGEEAMLKALMEKDGGDFSKLEIVNIGEENFFSATEKNVDFTWIYYGWDGVAADVKNIDINFIKLLDVDSELDFYTPVIIANNELINNNPELVKRFLRATTKGYEYTISNPEDSAKVLLKYAPELDEKLIIASQKYLANEFISDAARWGEMKEKTWTTYANWMYEKGLLENQLAVNKAFTNDFLPE